MNHIKRAQYVAILWKRADHKEPTDGANPLDYGWKSTDDQLEPEWYTGSAVSESLRCPPTTHTEDAELGDESEEADDVLWSEPEESDDSDEEDL